jgi:hypothetical protein
MRVAWSLAFLLAWSPQLALAAPTEAEINAARKLFGQAQEHEAEGRWIDALDLLQRILLVKETAGVRFHAALCREHLGQLLAAEADYRRAAELAAQMKSPEGAAIVEQTGRALEALKPRIPLITLRVPAGLKGLRVELDGVPLGEAQLGQPIPRDPGPLTVRATAPGHDEFSRQLALRERSNQTLEIVLSPTQPPPATSAPPPPPAALAADTRPAPPTRWPVYAAGGAALVAAGGSVFFYLQHQRLRQETDDICSNPEYRCDRAGRDARISDYQRYGLLSGGVALVGAGLTTYLYLSSGPKKSSTALVVGPGAVGVAGHW